eukprot:g24162.t1
MQELEKRLQYKRNRTSAKCRARLLILEKLVLTILKGSFKNGLAHSTSDHLPKWPARTKKYSTGVHSVICILIHCGMKISGPAEPRCTEVWPQAENRK